MLLSTMPNLSTTVSAWVPFEDQVVNSNTSVPSINTSINISTHKDFDFGISSQEQYNKLLQSQSPQINIGTSFQPSLQLRADPNDNQASLLSKSFANIDFKEQSMTISDNDFYKSVSNAQTQKVFDNLIYSRPYLLPVDNSKILNKNYLIKLDDDYKLVTDCGHLSSSQLAKIITTYYPSNELEIFPVANNINLLSSYICNPNSFLINNEIEPLMFIENFNKFDEMIGYLNIFGSSWKFTSALQNIGKSPDIYKNKIIGENIDWSKKLTKLGETKENNQFVNSLNSNTAMFNTTGTYINNICDVENISGYSTSLLSEFDGDNCGSGVLNFMNLENFSESILDYCKDYTI